MSLSQQIIAAIGTSPGGTVKQIAAAAGISEARVGPAISRLHARGRLTRTKAHTTPSGSIAYAYSLGSSQPSIDRAKPKSANNSNNTNNTNLTSLIDQMSRALANQIASGIGAHLMVELSKMAPDASTRVALPTAQDLIARVPLALPAPAARKLTKVVIVGMNSKQAGAIQNQFHDTLHIDFWNDKDGHSLEMLKQFSRHAEHVFFNMSNCSHTAVAMSQSVGATITRVSGGTTAMADALTKFYVEEVTS